MMRIAKIMIVFFVAALCLLVLCDFAWATEEPISYWAFDEGGGTEVHDSIGDNDGTIYGASWTTGFVNAALSFDGVDDYVCLLYPGPVWLNPRTVCAWAKTSSTDAQVILSYGPEYGDLWGQSFEVALCAFGDCEGVTVDVSGSAATYSATVTDGEWYYYSFVVPWVLDPPVTIWHVKVYKDGTLLTNRCAEFNIHQPIWTNGLYPIHIGRLHRPLWGIHYRRFNGIIDEIALYDRGLTDEEIWELYESALRPEIVAIQEIESAISEKVESLEKINAAISKEWIAHTVVEELLASGDYGSLKQGDVIKAKEKILSAIDHQEQAKKTLEKSIEKLEDALEALGSPVVP